MEAVEEEEEVHQQYYSTAGDLELTPKEKDAEKEKWWGDDHLEQIGGFWVLPQFIQPILRVIHHFHPLPTDIILASFPKTGTTWLKSLIFSIVHRSSKHTSTRLLLHHHNPHELVPTLEVQLYTSSSSSSSLTDVDEPFAPVNYLITQSDSIPPAHYSSSASDAPRRIISTHIPYQLLARTLDASDECRLVYVTRNPKDTLISMWHFVNKWDKAKEEPWPLEEAADNFCRGVIPCGPYYEHVLGYRKLSLERPNKLFFITYEELVNDPKTHVKNLAAFLGCPFEEEEEEGDQLEEAVVAEIVNSCSFQVLSNHEVNKSDDQCGRPSWFPQLSYNSFFRKGTVGDHKNYLNDDMINRIDELTRAKFHSLLVGSDDDDDRVLRNLTS